MNIERVSLNSRGMLKPDSRRRNRNNQYPSSALRRLMSLISMMPMLPTARPDDAPCSDKRNAHLSPQLPSYVLNHDKRVPGVIVLAR